MKKLILTSTALLAFAAATYAQVIQQVGQQQFAQHNQFGANQIGTINQVQNAVDPNRTKYENYSITFQDTPNNTEANTPLINQNDGSQGNRAAFAWFPFAGYKNECSPSEFRRIDVLMNRSIIVESIAPWSTPDQSPKITQPHM